MMSLLTRTKGYFVVICVLMCGFLLTFSWRLLYSSYDSATLLKPSTTLQTPNSVRQFHDGTHRPSASRSYVVKMAGDDISLKVKGRNRTKPFTKDEIDTILSKIHELGLSASEVQEKLLSWQKQGNMSKNTSSLYPKRQVITPMPSVKPIIRVNRHEYESDDTRVPSHRQQSLDHDADSPDKYRVSKHPANSQRLDNVIPNLPNEQDSVIKNNVDMDVHKNSLLDNKIHENSINKDKSPMDFQNRIANRMKATGTEVDTGQHLKDPVDRETMSRTAQNRKQREKYLQFLKEQFELSKTRNASYETKERRVSSGANQLKSDITEHKAIVRFTPSPQRNMEQETPRTPRPSHPTRKPPTNRGKSNTSMYQELRQKYPVFTQGPPKDENLPGVEGTQRPDYCRGCFDFNFPRIIDHPQLCKLSNSGGSKAVFLLMLISSAPSNYHARTVIRQTWGAKCREANSTLKCLFVIGISNSPDENSRVQLENDHHQDILQLGFHDSYSNLTYKTVSSFKWATQNCYSARYVMKTDDDMYVNTDLIPFMLQAAPSRKFMGGSCWGSSSPNRDTSSKWFVSLKSFHKPKFPPMCSGTGYIMSMDVLRSVLFASRNVPFFHLEDVYVALCLQKYGVLPVNIMGFSNMFQEFGACHYKNTVMTSHQVPPELLEEFWLSMNKCPKANVSPVQLYIIMPYPETD